MVNTKRYARKRRNEKKRFRFEAIWVKEPDCGEIISEAWREWPAYTTLKKIDHTKERLRAWHSLLFRKIRGGLNSSLRSFIRES